MKIFKRLMVLMGILLVLFQVPFSCAQMGRPEGGPQDTIPPVVINTSPENFSTHFKAKKIRIDFDEYIKLNDAQNQVLISPPFEKKPTITPMGQALKYIEIELIDSLTPNTTYTVNFGQSIGDNNEGNVLPFYKYVFSTGDYIDSLQVSGNIKDAYKRETDEYISVLLYKLDSTYTDSIVYKKPPAYLGSTQDSTNNFTIENIAEGSYKVFALKDKNQNYTFNPRSEKIGFLEDTIHLPEDQDKLYNLSIFKENRAFEIARVDQQSATQLLFGVHGGIDSVQIKLLSDRPDNYKEAYYHRRKSDTLDYWFTPYFEADSLVFELSKGDLRDTITTQLKEIETDSLRFKADPSSVLPLNGEFKLSANTPITEVNSELISVRDKDSIKVPFQTYFDAMYNEVVFDFEKRESDEYHIQALPGALKDFYGKQSDTLRYKLRTKAATDYADVHLQLENVDRYPLIVQLVTNTGETKRELIHQEEEGSEFSFSWVEPGMYYVRIIYDDNDNGKWDTGNYLKKRQPERVIYMRDPLDVRKNWEIVQKYTLPE